MKQILLKKGTIYTADIAAPQCEAGLILVRTEYSCISAGTEISGVKNSGTPVWKRALQNRELMRRGLKMLKERGVKDTLAVVKGKYEAGAPLGYSASGVVIESGSRLFQPGDRVACMGASYANHAGFIAVPENLAARLPDTVSFEAGATAAVGCIAMQGVRRADVRLGEYVVITGMGILGQIAARLCRAAGATVIAVDLDERRLSIAKNGGARYVLAAGGDVPGEVHKITGGHGADSVLITAASSSHELVSEAFQVCRRRGKVVLVGVVGLNIKRDDMYMKELDFSIATSYGPGRYDASYEEDGHDYPYAYVRFTEKRNLESYLRLLSEGRLDISPIIETVHPAGRADEAYAALQADTDRPLIVLLKYNEEGGAASAPNLKIINTAATPVKAPHGPLKVALCGAGGFAKSMHLPNMAKMPEKYTLHAVQSRTGANAKALATKYGASYAATDYEAVLADSDVDMVMICTRHDSHADMAIRALEAGKAVFVEKPMALTAPECSRVVEAAARCGRPFLVGFNRRFSKYARAVKEMTAERRNPLMASYRMNAGFIPPDHWIQGDKGGGRIIGEGCHIFDLFNFLTDSRAESLSVTQLSPRTDHLSRTDNVVVTVKYEDGSVCTLLYTALGHSDYAKEYLEVFVDGRVIVVDDCKSLTAYGLNAPALSSPGPEKGQYEELVAFYDSIKNGDGRPIPLWQLEQATLLSIMAQQ